MRVPSSVEVSIDLKLFSITGTWEPNDTERRAAWELYVELVTRVATVPLEYGLLREALTSLYSLFSSARDILRRYGPEIAEPKRGGEPNLAFLVVSMLNLTVRPTLSRWHPELEGWEASRLGDRSIPYAGLLAEACGVPNLLEPQSSVH
jgi:hypothetical protein